MAGFERRTSNAEDCKWEAECYRLESAGVLTEGGAGLWSTESGVTEVVAGIHRVRMDASASVRVFLLVSQP